jgi:hypothetical protein
VRRSALLALGLLLAAGCRTTGPPLTPLPPGDERPQRLLEALDARAAERRALRGRAELAVDGDDVRVRGRQILVAERPDRLRVEILGFLDQTQAVLTTDGEGYELFTTERGHESGAVYPGLLYSVARIDLEPRDVVDIVLGAPRPDPRLELARALSAPDGALRVELAGPRRRETLVFDAEGRLRMLLREVRGRRLWEARYDDYAPVSGTPFAHAIALDFAASGVRAQLSLRDVELNPELPDALFRLEPRRASARQGG